MNEICQTFSRSGKSLQHEWRAASMLAPVRLPSRGKIRRTSAPRRRVKKRQQAAGYLRAVGCACTDTRAACARRWFLPPPKRAQRKPDLPKCSNARREARARRASCSPRGSPRPKVRATDAAAPPLKKRAELPKRTFRRGEGQLRHVHDATGVRPHQ